MSDKPKGPPFKPKRLYGRRKGHPLSDYQAGLIDALMPKLAVNVDGPVDLADLFDSPGPLRLEIGFGGGEHLCHRAAALPDWNFIGVEPFENGMAKCLAGVDRNGLKNVRLLMDDARFLLDQLPTASVDHIDLLYPDPWPKLRHNKRRFVNQGNLDEIARVLKPGGKFCFASDIPSYVDWTLDHLRRHPGFAWQASSAADWRTPYDGWLSTRYEQKAIREGRTPHYLTFVRLNQPGD